MKFLDVFVNADVLAAEIALKDASSDTLIDACGNYIQRLKAYRLELRDLRCLSDDSLFLRSPLSRELITQARSAVRAVIEITVRETNRAESLLSSLSSINVHEAAAILNLCRYLGSKNWEANSGGVRFANGFDTGHLSVDTAVATASRLRREAYVVVNRELYPESAFAAAKQEEPIAEAA